MTPAKVLVVVGTRPEAVKLAPVVLELRRRPREFVARVCLSGQHRELVRPVLTTFGIEADQDLDVMTPGQTPAEVVGRLVPATASVLALERPSLMLVQGDTVTTFAAALAAYFAKISVGHVEAGLRTGEKFSPFPEEMNRRLTGSLADVHFAPTDRAMRNLLAEGISPERITTTGNTAVDAAQFAARLKPTFADPRLENLEKRIVLVTAHRRESFGEPMRSIARAVRRLAQSFRDVTFVVAVHPNPEVGSALRPELEGLTNVLLTAPLDYGCFLSMLRRSELALSDSGGVQEEGPSLGTPVLVLRDTTERPEAIESGAALLVGTSESRIIAEASRVLCEPLLRQRMAGAVNPFGDGRAAQRIVDFLCAHRSLWLRE